MALIVQSVATAMIRRVATKDRRARINRISKRLTVCVAPVMALCGGLCFYFQAPSILKSYTLSCSIDVINAKCQVDYLLYNKNGESNGRNVGFYAYNKGFMKPWMVQVVPFGLLSNNIISVQPDIVSSARGLTSKIEQMAGEVANISFNNSGSLESAFGLTNDRFYDLACFDIRSSTSTGSYEATCRDGKWLGGVVFVPDEIGIEKIKSLVSEVELVSRNKKVDYWETFFWNVIFFELIFALVCTVSVYLYELYRYVAEPD